MNNSNHKFAANVVYAIAALALCAALARPVFFISQAQRDERAAIMNFNGVELALDIYSKSNKGAFPESGKVKGGSGPDALLGAGMLIRYPANPFSIDGAPIENVNSDVFSPGDFIYERRVDRDYEYRLFGFGSTKAVFEKRFIE